MCEILLKTYPVEEMKTRKNMPKPTNYKFLKNLEDMMISNIRLGKKKTCSTEKKGFSPLKCDENHFWNKSFFGKNPYFKWCPSPFIYVECPKKLDQRKTSAQGTLLVQLEELVVRRPELFHRAAVEWSPQLVLQRKIPREKKRGWNHGYHGNPQPSSLGGYNP